MKKDPNLTTIYLVRHGEAEHNLKNAHGEIPLSQLTQTGVLQAKSLAKKMSKIHIDHIFASDFVRAKRTAEIIALDRKLEVITIKALRERNYGSLNGLNAGEIRELIGEIYDEYTKLPGKEKFHHKLTDDMESRAEAAQRMVLFLREVAIGYPGQNMLVVCHSGVMRSVLVQLGYIESHDGDKIMIDNTGYVCLECDSVDFFIKETFGITKKRE